MKKTEWFYDHNKNQWWMVNVVTNAKYIPKIRLGDKPTTSPVRIKGINLHDENKNLTRVILTLAGCLGLSLGTIAVMLVS